MWAGEGGEGFGDLGLRDFVVVDEQALEQRLVLLAAQPRMVWMSVKDCSAAARGCSAWAISPAKRARRGPQVALVGSGRIRDRPWQPTGWSAWLVTASLAADHSDIYVQHFEYTDVR